MLSSNKQIKSEGWIITKIFRSKDFPPAQQHKRYHQSNLHVYYHGSLWDRNALLKSAKFTFYWMYDIAFEYGSSFCQRFLFPVAFDPRFGGHCVFHAGKNVRNKNTFSISKTRLPWFSFVIASWYLYSTLSHFVSFLRIQMNHKNVNVAQNQ